MVQFILLNYTGQSQHLGVERLSLVHPNLVVGLCFDGRNKLIHWISWICLPMWWWLRKGGWFMGGLAVAFVAGSTTRFVTVAIIVLAAASGGVIIVGEI